jgi:tetratricopeptide (TPR) repeat protein
VRTRLAAALLVFGLLAPPSAATAAEERPEPAGLPAGIPVATPAQRGTAPSGDEKPDSLSMAIGVALGEIRRHPASGAARLPLAEAYRSRGNLVAARATAEEALRLGLSEGDSVRVEMILADVAVRQGKLNEARTRLNSLIDRKEAGPDLLAMSAQMLWDDHQPEAALALGMEAAARGPNDVARIRWLAERWKESGRADQALVLWKKIVAQPQATDEDLFQVGFLSHKLGDGEGAVDSYLKLLDRAPTHPQGNYNLSLLMLALGDTAQAASHLELAIQGAPTMQRAYFDLAVLYLHSGRVADARRILTLFRGAAGADSVLNAEVDGILEGLPIQKDRSRKAH